MSQLTHFDSQGQAHMVNVGKKEVTHRIAVAEGSIAMCKEAYDKLTQGHSQKGDVLGVARIAAIQATKNTSHLIPLCHPIALTHVAVEFIQNPEECSVLIRVTTETTGVTGVEMEALTGVSVGLLTIYDMLKAVDKSMEIGHIGLCEKIGGKSGHYIQNKTS